MSDQINFKVLTKRVRLLVSIKEEWKASDKSYSQKSNLKFKISKKLSKGINTFQRDSMTHKLLKTLRKEQKI